MERRQLHERERVYVRFVQEYASGDLTRAVETLVSMLRDHPHGNDSEGGGGGRTNIANGQMKVFLLFVFFFVGPRCPCSSHPARDASLHELL